MTDPDRLRVRRAPPPFRTASVVDTTRPGPRLATITIAADSLRDFAPAGPAASVRLLLPEAAGLVLPAWNGNEFLLPDGRRPGIRTLTPGRVDRAAGTLDLAVVLHGTGRLSDWAEHVRPGAPTGYSGPGAGYTVDPTRSRYLLAGDETALPAIVQLLAAIPAAATIDVVIEIAAPDGRIGLPAHPGATVEWVESSRDSAPGAALVAAVLAPRHRRRCRGVGRRRGCGRPADPQAPLHRAGRRSVARDGAGVLEARTDGHVSPGDAIVIVLAGMGAGMINTVVGSGSLITFPTLIALGYPPVLANVSNNIGLVPGALSGVYGYRRELRGQRARLLRLIPASVAGGTVGSILLLVLPSSVFDRVVIVLIAIALVLVVIGPKLSRRLARPHGTAGAVPLGLVVLVGLTGIYGGYFGAAQGIILIALLGIFVLDDLQRLNATKNVLAMSVNLVATVVFLLAAKIDWAIVACIAGGSIVGGQLGATVGRRLDPRVLRGVIVVVGLTALVRLL